MAAAAARDAGAVALVAEDVPSLLRALDGRTVHTMRGPVVLATANRPDRPVTVRFHEIGLTRRVLHAVGTPGAVYVLLVLGLWGLAFELTQPGFGMAGIAGVVFLVFAGYGLSVVPVNWLGLALIVASKPSAWPASDSNFFAAARSCRYGSESDVMPQVP